MNKKKMHKIAGLLIDFGMDFQYENRGSQGEKIISFECSLEVCIQNGKIYLEYIGEQSVFDEDEKHLSYIVKRVNEICIEETT